MAKFLLEMIHKFLRVPWGLFVNLVDSHDHLFYIPSSHANFIIAFINHIHSAVFCCSGRMNNE